MFHLHIKEGIAKALFVAAAGISVLAVALICVFLFANGVPAIAQIGLPEFLFGTTWRPANDIYGIFPMIVGSIYVTAGAILVGVPTGLLCAIFLSRFASGKIAAFLKPGVELLAGIPSVVYGFVGLVMIVPFIRDNMPGRGLSLLAAAVLLGIMILPTIITVAQSALDAVPKKYYEGALALAQITSARCSELSFPLPSPASWPASCWAWAAPSARPWPSSWWPATSPSFPRASSRACAP